MPHFFINSSQIKENKIADKENFKHIIKALRTKIGENLKFIDENGMIYESILKKCENNELIAEISNSYPCTRYLDFELCLAQSPLNSNSQNTIIEKATELGVSQIYPIYTDNCAVKKSVLDSKIPKWQKIMQEASKQCERAFVPVCNPLTNLNEVLKMKFDRILVMAEKFSNETLKSYLLKNSIKNGEIVLVIIGPEGGFSNEEFDLFKSLPNVKMLSLGKLILKADTAVISALGNIVL